MARKCSICGKVTDPRGWYSHNEHNHEGQADYTEVEDPEPEPEETNEPEETDNPADLSDPDGDDLDADDLAEDPNDEPEELEYDDDDAKEYNCGSCGTQVEYLEKQCPNCGETLQWSAL